MVELLPLLVNHLQTLNSSALLAIGRVASLLFLVLEPVMGSLSLLGHNHIGLALHLGHHPVQGQENAHDQH